MADPSATTKKRAADLLAEAKRRSAEHAERRARAATPGPSIERVTRDESADARKARQNADVMAAAEDGLAIARASRDPRKIRDAIAALTAARVFTGDSQPVTGHVSVIIEGMDEPDDDDVTRGDSSVATADQIQ